MDRSWSPDDKEFGRERQAFLDEHTPAELGHVEHSPVLLPECAPRWLATLFDHGWMVPEYPPELGGRNATLRQSVMYIEELAAREVPRSLHFAGYAIVAPTFMQFGTPGQQAMAPAALVIDMRAPGVEVSPVRHLGGTAEFVEIAFDQVAVPRDALVGDLDGGWAVINGSLDHERSVTWFESLEHVVHDIIALAGPDADPGTRRAVAEAYERASSLRALGFGSLTGDPVLALHLKVATSELYSELLEIGALILGPSGAVMDPAAATPRRSWISDLLRGFAGTLAGGTSEIQRDIVARHGLHLLRR